MSEQASFRPRLNLLVAYPYVTQRILETVAEMGDDVRFLLDSGAFTAFKIGRKITVEEYCDFLKRLAVKPWRYFSLDVIGDPLGSERNYHEMLDRGFRPIPVFTRGGSLDELDRYYETSDVVGLGGVAGADRSAYQWLRAVFNHLGGRKAHVLGMASMNWIKFLRPYTCDASSWERSSRYGQLHVYTGQGRFAAYTTKDAAVRGPPAEMVQSLRALGIDAHALRRRESWCGGESCVRWASAASWIQASIDIEQKIGTKMFLALAADSSSMLQAGFLAACGKLDLEQARRQFRASKPSQRGQNT